MAFIRRVRTTSGATAVQVAEYRDGRQRVVKHFGSAYSDVELGVLIEMAEQWLVGSNQPMFDLDIPRRSQPVLASRSTQDGLFSAPSTSTAFDSAGRVVSTCSRLLFEVLAEVYVDLGFDVVSDPVFRDLVVARIAEPTSLLDVRRVLDDLGRQPASYKTMTRIQHPGRHHVRRAGGRLMPPVAYRAVVPNVEEREGFNNLISA